MCLGGAQWLAPLTSIFWKDWLRHDWFVVSLGGFEGNGFHWTYISMFTGGRKRTWKLNQANWNVAKPLVS